MPLSRLYQTQLLEHNRKPHNRRELPDATHSARGTDALCGDDLAIWLRVEGEVIDAAGWSGEACAVTTASASMLTDWLPGRTRRDVEIAAARFDALLSDPDAPDDPELGDLNVLRAVGGFPSRRRNAQLPWKTALRALRSAE